MTKKKDFFETPCLKHFIKSAEYYLVFEGCEFIFSICSVQIIFIFIIFIFHTTGTKPCSNLTAQGGRVYVQ